MRRFIESLSKSLIFLAQLIVLLTQNIYLRLQRRYLRRQVRILLLQRAQRKKMLEDVEHRRGT